MLTAVEPIGIWHDGENMVVFLPTEKGKAMFLALSRIDPFERNDMLAEVVSIAGGSNEGAQAVVCVPAQNNIKAFPPRMLIAMGDWAKGMDYRYEFTDDEVKRIKGAQGLN